MQHKKEEETIHLYLSVCLITLLRCARTKRGEQDDPRQKGYFDVLQFYILPRPAANGRSCSNRYLSRSSLWSFKDEDMQHRPPHVQHRPLYVHDLMFHIISQPAVALELRQQSPHHHHQQQQ